MIKMSDDLRGYLLAELAELLELEDVGSANDGAVNGGVQMADIPFWGELSTWHFSR
jgi:hypothetical protein